MAPPKVAPKKKGRGRRGNRRFPYPEVAPKKKGRGRRGNRRFPYSGGFPTNRRFPYRTIFV